MVGHESANGGWRENLADATAVGVIGSALMLQG